MAKFQRKAAIKAAVADSGEVDIQELVESAKDIGGVFTPRDIYEPLLEVTDWIPMPKPIQDLMGTPGIPCGLIIEVYGKKDCGKTTFATEALASVQREGGIAILLDTENKYSLKRAAAMGLDVKRLIIIKAKTIEEAFDKFQAMVILIKNKKDWTDKKTGELLTQKQYEELKSAQQKKLVPNFKYSNKKVCAVWDSLGATPCEAELDDNKTDFSMNAAKAIKGRLRKILYYIKDTRVSLVLINQVYSNTSSFGKKTTPYGGSGPEYHCAMIMEFAALGRIRPPGVKPPADFCGIHTQIEVVKNHLGQPFKKGLVDIDWKGFVVSRDAEYAPEDFNERTASEPDEEVRGAAPERSSETEQRTAEEEQRA